MSATDVVVIWSSSQSRVNVGPAAKASGSNRKVYLGFVADPELDERGLTSVGLDALRGD